MFLEMPYSQLAERYPSHVEEVVAEIRRGVSKRKNDAPESFQWGFDWAVLITGSGTLTNIFQARERESVWTEAEKLDDYASRCRVHLSAYSKPRRWLSTTTLEVTPSEILEPHREYLRGQEAERGRVEALTPTAREEELRKNLKALQGPGFVMIEMLQASTATK